MHAIVITTLGEARDVKLPDDAGQHTEIRRILGGSPDQAVYHPGALLWVHGNGAAEGLRSNLPAWTLACAWRGLTLPYELFGDILITGRTAAGDAESLKADLAEQVRTVTTTTLETIRRWQERPPTSNEAGLSELLAYASRDVGR